MDYLMRQLLILVLMLAVSGCASFGRGVAEALINDKKEDTRQCEIQGSPLPGIDDLFADKRVVKVMMVHGVGTHHPGYATRIRENLALKLGLNVFSRRDKDIALIDPQDKKTVIGNLRATRMQNESASKDMIFYELTWSKNTSLQKRILDYDISGLYEHKRAAFNHTMKKFLDDVIPDPEIYLTDKNDYILNATKQATCWMLSRSWEQLRPDQKQVCEVSSFNQIKDLSRDNIIFITHSLGSKILMDSLSDIVNTVTSEEVRQSMNRHRDVRLIIEDLKNKQMTVFMLANQLPLLQIAGRKPAVTGQIPSYCYKKGRHYEDRVFKKINVVAFSDPNDLLSYGLTQDFVDNYLDSRMCPAVTNVTINIAEEISVFGAGVVNPVTAHTEYDNDTRVIEMIAKGTENIRENEILSKRCRFTRLK